MVDLFFNLPSKPKVWLCIPVPLIPGRQDERMNNLENIIIPIVKQIAEEKQVGLIDLYATLKGRPELFTDRVHPTKAGAKLIARDVCRKLTGREPPMHEVIDIGKMILFGDSTTVMRDGLEVYSQVLKEELSDNNIEAEIVNAGVGGNSTLDARKRFGNDVISEKPDFVVIQFGINDSMVDVWKDIPAKAPRVSIQIYEKNLTYFVATLKRYDIPVVLMSPNPLRSTDKLKTLYGKAPYDIEDVSGLSLILEDYAKIVRKIAVSQKVPFIDVYAAFENYGKVAYQSVDDLLIDGIHPNNTGHRIIAHLLLWLKGTCAPSAVSSLRERCQRPSFWLLLKIAAPRRRVLLPESYPF